MKTLKYVPLLIVLSVVYCFPQVTSKDTSLEQQRKLNKKIAVGNFELQIKDVRYAAVRSFIKINTASWLWKEGKDETGRAEDLVVKALEDLYEHKKEIPDIYFSSLKTSAFALLNSNAPAIARDLEKKYNECGDCDSASLYDLLNAENGEKRVADKLKNFIQKNSEVDSTIIEIINELSNRRSPELSSILKFLIAREENGGNILSVESSILIVNTFRNPAVELNLKYRFYNLVLNKVREALISEGADFTAGYELIYAVSEDISKNAPDLFSEAEALRNALKNRIDRTANINEEVYERIEKSSDRLSAMISEAEAADDEPFKRELYSNASLLALKKMKFSLAVDLMEKSIRKEDLNNQNSKFFSRWHDQFLSEVSEKALKSADAESSRYAEGKIIDKLVRANVLRKTANYFNDKKNAILATDALEESFKLSDEVENTALKTKSLLSLIPSFQKFDKTMLQTVLNKTAKSINSLPTLNTDDKEDSENYKNYVASMMIINVNLLPVMKYLNENDKVSAIDLTNRIERTEIKIASDFSMMANNFK